MSLITRCPACQTLFKVVPDQLRISEGWVRCGQCDEIFDASLNLLQASPEETPDESTAKQVSGDESPADAPDPVDLDGHDVPPEYPPELPLPSEAPVPDVPEEVANLSVPEPMADEVLGVSDEDPSPSGDLQGVPADALQSATLPLATEPVVDVDVDVDVEAPDIDPADSQSEVSFLRDKKRETVWQKPFVRVALIGLSVTLVLGLAGQIVFHERDRMLALEPGLRPWLLALCAPLNCTLSPFRQIESIEIDSSSFAKIRGDAYRLSFTLKNTASIALAVPSVELTLTDILDRPVLRRVFNPSELGVKMETFAAGSEWSESVAMTARAEGASDKVAGYRLFVFYP